jgi:hypothetical protein
MKKITLALLISLFLVGCHTQLSIVESTQTHQISHRWTPNIHYGVWYTQSYFNPTFQYYYYRTPYVIITPYRPHTATTRVVHQRTYQPRNSGILRDTNRDNTTSTRRNVRRD